MTVLECYERLLEGGIRLLMARGYDIYFKEYGYPHLTGGRERYGGIESASISRHHHT